MVCNRLASKVHNFTETHPFWGIDLLGVTATGLVLLAAVLWLCVQWVWVH